MMKVLLFLAFATTAMAMKLGHQAKRQNAPFVAFSAGLNQMLNVTTGVNVAFNKIFINTGNGYDSTTGIFTAPTDGTYVFIYHGLSEVVEGEHVWKNCMLITVARQDGKLHLDLFKNNVYEVTAYAHNSGDYASVSNSIVMTLAQGDQIHLQSRDVNQLYGATDEVYATFSGFILNPSSGGN